MARSRAIRAAGVALAIPLLPLVGVHADVAAQQPSAPPMTPVTGLPKGTHLKVDGQARKSDEPARANGAAKAQAAAATPPVGTVRQWVGLDVVQGNVYRKDYTLRAVGNKIEVWVANDRAFPAGDCRNAVPGSTDVTDEQVGELISEFDNTMYPKETSGFSTPPNRDGTHATMAADADGKGGDYTGDGDKTVTLVDNVRDENYFDFPDSLSYVAGFFAPAINQALDRNVMTIDVFDWKHKTTASPPNDPTNDVCTTRTAAPFAYESTFAHEYQHLLQFYIDPTESTWLNEGLSMYAESLTGYSTTTAIWPDPSASIHIGCFQGFATLNAGGGTTRPCGGAENSLTLWNEGAPDDVLADYGNAYQFMLYLYDHYGQDFMSRLHRDGERHGLDSVAAQLKVVGEKDLSRVLHDYQTSVLVDKFVGEDRGRMLGVDRKRVTSASVRSTVDLPKPAAYATPGAAPNGADYVQLRGADGVVLKGCDLKSLTFEGASSLPPTSLQWTAVTNDPDRPGDSVLWSGNASNLNAVAVIPVTVPSDTPTLRFLAKYGAEEGFDYAYVTVSTDGGATYKVIKGDKTVDGPLGPALNGKTNGFEPRSYDLSAYAGEKVLLGLQYVSDGGVNEGGLFVDDVTIGGTTISDGTNVTAFKSPTQIKPLSVNNWNLRLAGLDEKNSIALQIQFNGKPSVKLGGVQLALLSAFPKVVAMVAYDEPTEKITQYAPYKLTVNGVPQPGG
ncbi:hypothetical protein [Actinocrispum sp. NPDC049592]|uniref:hypothetical protein n=1 Tax=Actinocrispum sp. NPDC049592 TaxID=3154835 RepID=UPI00343FBE51